MKIFFVGMPGSGKTTLGEQVAQALTLPFVDLDKEIEKHEGRSVPEIFQQKGEAHFRMIESALLRTWAARQENFVMSTGGGAPCYFDGMDVINANGISIFIDVEVDILVERTKSKSHRPLLNSGTDEELKTTLNNLLAQREKIYRKATFTLVKPTLSSVMAALNLKK